MNNADKRSVHTDALDTLGMILGPNEKRDAIHLAVEPVVAADEFWPGERVALGPNGTACRAGKIVGIVDPFLDDRVRRGERFWLVVLPRTIRSLRHVWEHPDFPASETSESAPGAPAGDAVSASRKWIEDFAGRIDQTYSRLMNAAENWLQYDDYTRDDSEAYKAYWDEFPEFWKHFEIVTGKAVAEEKRESFFTCSC
ncbi:hypothetical protein [Burkholderia multivorans]|uniref:hypothetical protein n=1 Tax=Burkholderia multivorans TaxID=87883 RepID=UPI0020B45E58|nr:hypothetical protein [Burkholderia multivorans]